MPAVKRAHHPLFHVGKCRKLLFCLFIYQVLFNEQEVVTEQKESPSSQEKMGNRVEQFGGGSSSDRRHWLSVMAHKTSHFRRLHTRSTEFLHPSRLFSKVTISMFPIKRHVFRTLINKLVKHPELLFQEGICCSLTRRRSRWKDRVAEPQGRVSNQQDSEKVEED